MPSKTRPHSADEYCLGYRTQVGAMLDAQSPPPSPTTMTGATYLLMAASGEAGGEGDENRKVRQRPTIRSTGSVDEVQGLAQHLAEAFKASLAVENRQMMKIIPTISIDDSDETNEPSTQTKQHQAGQHWSSRHPSIISVSSSTPSDATSQYSGGGGTLGAIEKNDFMVMRIQRLVSAFRERAQAIKEHIAQPTTPSTDASEHGEAPGPPPLTFLRPQDSTPEIQMETAAKPWRIPTTFHPQSSMYIVWLCVVTSAFIYNLWGVPLRWAFHYQNEDNVYVWLTFDYICDAIYLLDTILVRPRLRFVRDGIWVQDVNECHKNYIRTFGFKLDAVSLLPLDLLYVYFGVQASLLRVPRMLRFAQFWELFDRLDMMVSSPFIIRVGRTLFYMLLLIHLNACAYYTYSDQVGLGSTSFVFQGNGDAYIRCFYFAMKTATKIGKNPKPVNSTDRTFMIFNWLIGVFVCAAILGQMRDIMAASGKTMTEYREQVDRTVTYMNRLHLPSTIQDRVRSWFSYNWTMHKTLDEKSSLVSLPLHMQMDIAMNVHIQTLSKVQLFQECDPSFIRDLVLKLKPVLFLPGDLVCKKGEVGKEMYIIKMGHVQVMGGENNDKVLVTLSEGSVFGEISLLAVGGGNRRMADVRSKGYSNLFMLSKADLNATLEDHHQAQKVLQRKARKLVKQNSSKRELSPAAVQPVIAAVSPPTTPRPPTPKLIKTVLQAVPSDSKTSHLLLRGSRSLASLQSAFSGPPPSSATASVSPSHEITTTTNNTEPNSHHSGTNAVVVVEAVIENEVFFQRPSSAASAAEELVLKPIINHLVASASSSSARRSATARSHLFKHRIAPATTITRDDDHIQQQRQHRK